MSTQAQATSRKGFRKASAARKPKLFCTGYVAEIGEGKESDSGVYNVCTVKINGLGGSPNSSVTLCHRPEWFETSEDGNPTFHPDKLEKGDEAEKKMLFVYRKNINAVDGVSNLHGLAGNDERFADLAATVLETEGITGDDSAMVFAGVLEKKLLAQEGDEEFEIGYILKQQRIKTDDVDENGKTIYLATGRYEIDAFFEATDENKKKYRKIAEKSAEKAEKDGTPVFCKVAFDDGTPF